MISDRKLWAISYDDDVTVDFSLEGDTITCFSQEDLEFEKRTKGCKCGNPDNRERSLKPSNE